MSAGSDSSVSRLLIDLNIWFSAKTGAREISIYDAGSLSQAGCVKLETAKYFTNLVGWLVLGASFAQIPLFVAGTTFWTLGLSGYLLAVSWASFALGTATGIALIQRARIGYYLLYVTALISLLGLGPRISFVPFSNRFLPVGPESEYYQMALNVIVILLVVWCHWNVAVEAEPGRVKKERGLALGFIVLFAAGLIFWKTGIRTEKGQVAHLSETPLVGKYLMPLESAQPVSFRSLEFLRQQNGTVVFNGSATEKNLREFAVANDLKLMTNLQARVKFLSIVKAWKLNPEQFPIFNGDNDLCYIGRVPKGSRLVLQICMHPSDGRFTAMAMGSPTTPRLANSER